MPAPRTLRAAGAAALLAVVTSSALTAAPASADVVAGHQVYGAILARYTALGGPAGLLGLPTTDELPAGDGTGRLGGFARGTIVWSPATGAHEVHGGIGDRWAGLGGVRSLLGYPVTDELGTPDGRGRYGEFAFGSVYWSPASGAHEVHGAIRTTWSALGRERSALGYPTSEEYGADGGRRSDFTGGSIIWTPAGGTMVRTAATPAPAPTPAPPPAPAPVSPPPAWFGVLQPRATTLGTLRPAGLARATLELGWNDYEPVQGSFNAGYAAQLRSRYAAMRAAGLDVVLDAGLQYAPSWVFGADGSSRFADQYGDRWQAGTGADVPDAVFDQRVRRAQAAYLTRLAADLHDLPFAAVRVGGLWYGETHFPAASYAGRGNAFWAYSPAAQAASPVPGYRPGGGDSATAARFLDWYLGSLADYSRWLATTYRTAFGSGPRLEVLMPSWGVRPGEVQAAGDGRLTGGSRAELTGALNEGLDWARQLPLLAQVGGVGGIEAYSTWLDAPDQGTDATYESPVRYLVRVARPLGLAVSGENTGGGSYADLQRCVQRVRELGLTGMMWMREPELADGVHASLADYRALVQR